MIQHETWVAYPLDDKQVLSSFDTKVATLFRANDLRRVTSAIRRYVLKIEKLRSLSSTQGTGYGSDKVVSMENQMVCSWREREYEWMTWLRWRNEPMSEDLSIHSLTQSRQAVQSNGYVSIEIIVVDSKKAK